MTRVHFHSPLGDTSVEVEPGTSLLDAAQRCGAPVGHSCGGVCACSTCHVWVRRGLASISEQEDAELDRLEQAFDVRPASRLSCQARAGAEEVEVAITEESLTAYLDEHPALRREFEAAGRWPLRK